MTPVKLLVYGLVALIWAAILACIGCIGMAIWNPDRWLQWGLSAVLSVIVVLVLVSIWEILDRD